MFTPGTIELKVSLFKFFITILLGGNTGLLGFLLRYGWKNYKKYKNAFMVFIEEHEKLVDDYLRRHPEELDSYPNYFSRLPSGRRKKSLTTIKRRPGVESHTRNHRTDDSTE